MYRKKLNNMNTKLKTLCLLIFVVQSALSIDFKPINWEKKPKFVALDDSLLKENAVYLKYEVRYDFRHEDNGNLYQYETEHKIVRIHNSESIKNFNTYHLNDESVLEWVTIKARTFSNDGKISEFDDKNIKKVVDKESGNTYKIFAVDGIEEGNTVEFLTIKKKSAESFLKDYFQFYYPVIKANYTISCPDKLRYLCKVYNGKMFEQKPLFADSLVVYNISGENIPALYDERYSYRNKNRLRIECRLDRNLYKGKYQINIWDVAAKNIYEQFFHLSKKEQKRLDDFISGLNIIGLTEKERILYIEDIVKKDLFIQESYAQGYTDLDFVLEQKISYGKGIAKLLANVFKRINIKHNVVMTSSREDVEFDKDFPSWNYLSKYLIYFPDLDMYLDPSEKFYRLGEVPGLNTAQYGMFIQEISVGDFKSAIANIKYIKESKAEDNYDHIYAKVYLDVDAGNTIISLERAFKGLSGGYLSRVIPVLDDERKENSLKTLSALNDLNPEFKELKIIDKSSNPIAHDAGFIFQGEMSTPALFEYAGNNILFKVGILIGPQAEMYQEGERQATIENSFNRSYFRELKIKIPEGYQFKNPQVGEINVTSSEVNPKFGFISKVNMDKDFFTITIDEYYKSVYAPKEDVEAFIKVVNAAADFNKVVLVLEKVN
jgi:hypothetical protein